MRSLSSVLLGVLTLLVGCPAFAEPMECTPETLRMALSKGGTMPGELVRACQAIPRDDEMFSLAQYMVSVHFQRRHEMARAAQALTLAASRSPFATDPRVLYRLSSCLIAAGDLEGALVAKDRLLFNSAALDREQRLMLFSSLHRMLSSAYELQALAAQERGDDDRYRQAMIRATFYREAARHLHESGPEGEAVGYVVPQRPELQGDGPVR